MLGITPHKMWDLIYIYIYIHTRGYSKSSKTNSKKYFIYEIYKIIFLHSFHPIHNTSVSDVPIEKFRPGIFRRNSGKSKYSSSLYLYLLLSFLLFFFHHILNCIL